MVNYYNEETERYESDNYGRFQRFTSIYHAKNFIDKLVSKMPTFESKMPTSNSKMPTLNSKTPNI